MCMIKCTSIFKFVNGGGGLVNSQAPSSLYDYFMYNVLLLHQIFIDLYTSCVGTNLIYGFVLLRNSPFYMRFLRHI